MKIYLSTKTGEKKKKTARYLRWSQWTCHTLNVLFSMLAVMDMFKWCFNISVLVVGYCRAINSCLHTPPSRELPCWDNRIRRPILMAYRCGVRSFVPDVMLEYIAIASPLEHLKHAEDARHSFGSAVLSLMHHGVGLLRGAEIIFNHWSLRQLLDHASPLGRCNASEPTGRPSCM